MLGSFFDSNVLLYLASPVRDKAGRAREMLASGGTISVQVLNEITNVSRRKMQQSWEDTLELLALVRSEMTVVDFRLADHERGIEIARRYKFSIYDSMIVSAALASDCDRLYSEDLHHGLIIDGRLTVVNPFAPAF